jgi:hypothetical protein
VYIIFYSLNWLFWCDFYMWNDKSDGYSIPVWNLMGTDTNFYPRIQISIRSPFDGWVITLTDPLPSLCRTPCVLGQPNPDRGPAQPVRQIGIEDGSDGCVTPYGWGIAHSTAAQTREFHTTTSLESFNSIIAALRKRLKIYVFPTPWVLADNDKAIRFLLNRAPLL